jgi:putative endonuclease
MATDTRRDLGTLGETIAADHLTRSGYRVLERNFRTRHGELDLVASGAGALVFCEVKTRIAVGSGDPFAPLRSVGSSKRRQVRRLAREWLAARAGQERPRPDGLRFDAIGVTLSPGGRLLELEHLEAAF